MTEDVIFVDKDVELKYVLKLMKKHVPDLVAEEELEIGIIFDFTNPLSNSNGRYVVKEKEGRESVTINDPLKELIVNKICT